MASNRANCKSNFQFAKIKLKSLFSAQTIENILMVNTI